MVKELQCKPNTLDYLTLSYYCKPAFPRVTVGLRWSRPRKETQILSLLKFFFLLTPSSEVGHVTDTGTETHLPMGRLFSGTDSCPVATRIGT